MYENIRHATPNGLQHTLRNSLKLRSPQSLYQFSYILIWSNTDSCFGIYPWEIDIFTLDNGIKSPIWNKWATIFNHNLKMTKNCIIALKEIISTKFIVLDLYSIVTQYSFVRTPTWLDTRSFINQIEWADYSLL